VTHWSSRLLAELGVSHSTVARVWVEHDLKPWRVETFKFSTDPQLEAKIPNVVGLCPMWTSRFPAIRVRPCVGRLVLCGLHKIAVIRLVAARLAAQPPGTANIRTAMARHQPLSSSYPNTLSAALWQ
jgi:hypothetical protein